MHTRTKTFTGAYRPRDFFHEGILVLPRAGLVQAELGVADEGHGGSLRRFRLLCLWLFETIH